MTAAELESAPVPSLRGNPAGDLVNGVLPNPTGQGSVELITTGGAAPAFGDMTGDGVAEAAAVIGFTSGVGGEDEQVDLYANGPHLKLLGTFDPVVAAPNTYHAQIMAMTIEHEEILIDWSGDPLANSGPVTYWSAHLVWNGHQIEAENVLPHTGATGAALWSNIQLTISTIGLGAVHIGMTLNQAEQAAGMPFDGAADGYIYPTQLPPHYPYLYVGLRDGSNVVQCIGASINPSSVDDQTIATPDGFEIGDSIAKLKAIYGDRVHYSAPPTTGGISDYGGYVVNEDGGSLVFISYSQGKIQEIAAGPPGMTPNSCTG